MQNSAPDIPMADELADLADRDEDIFRFFTNTEKMTYLRIDDRHETNMTSPDLIEKENENTIN